MLCAKYYIETSGELADVGAELAEIETTGKWSLDKKQTELFTSCKGYVHEIEEIEKGRGYITLAIPMQNLDMENSAFSSLWLYMVGGATHALISYNKSRLVDFWFPDEYNKYFPGPKWGIDGLRKYLGVPSGEPILGTIVKPTSGLDADEVASICGSYASGGLQFIKDDEKYMNTPHCPIKERVEKAMKKICEAEDKTGKKVLYTPHITTGPENILKFGETALKAGARGLMINIFSSSFSCLKMLRDEFDVPVYAHCGGKEALGRAPGQGVAPEVAAKLARLMGAEFFRSNILGGYLVGGTNEEIDSLIHTMRAPMKGIKDLVPALSGGLSPKNLGENLKAFGTGIMALAGSGITQYPGGIACGVEAMKAVAADYTGR
ncbi:MAG: RuBisCO large subunit C-terminal-like domain-containing protein [Oscillospiraceae bacterium]|nr:RuBisCO large subunit C-terminal-like domain-containing protein [Oscillospiraceae bacterium]